MLAFAAVADPSAPLLSGPEAETIAVQAFGVAHPDCAEWSDACVVCRRADPAPACSTPGIACLPEPTVCRRSQEKP